MEQAVLKALLEGPDPDREPFRPPEDRDSDEGSASGEPGAADLAGSGEPMDPDMARVLEDSAIRQQLGIGGNFTGPKGVANDHKFHQRQEQARNAARKKADIKRWSEKALSSGWLQRQLASERSGASTTKAPVERRTGEDNGGSDDEDDELEEDDVYLQEYRSRRMLELKAMAMRPKFGGVRELETADFVSAIDNEDPSVTIVIHIYERHIEACRLINTFLDKLATDHPTVKFAKILASKTDSSFDPVALPALLVYEAGSLTHTLLRITDEIPGWARTGRVSFDEFESYLWDTRVLTDSTSSLARILSRSTQGSSSTL